MARADTISRPRLLLPAVLLGSAAALVAAVAGASTAHEQHRPASVARGFLDFLWDLSLGDEAEQRQGVDGGSPLERACSCEGPACTCCVDFNFTYVDLGGPGCVQMTYISPAEGINVNISYGENVLLSEAIKGANPEPACLDMVGGLAQMCARFSDLAATADGLRWCLQLEPVLLGDTQAQLPLGCFRMGPDGMVPDPPSGGTQPQNTTAEVTEEELNEEALIAAVNESAEESISLLSNLLGLTFGESADEKNKTQEESNVETTTIASEESNKERSFQTWKNAKSNRNEISQ